MVAAAAEPLPPLDDAEAFVWFAATTAATPLADAGPAREPDTFPFGV